MIEYRKATMKDIDLLTQLREEVLRAANRLKADDPMPDIKDATYEYYYKSLDQGAHIAYLALDGDIVAGCGGVSFYQVMPTCGNPTGKKAYIMNMYTRPEYRRRGIAGEILELLIQSAKQSGAGQILLEATAAGRPLYVKYGFEPMPDEMELVSPLI